MRSKVSRLRCSARRTPAPSDSRRYAPPAAHSAAVRSWSARRAPPRTARLPPRCPESDSCASRRQTGRRSATCAAPSRAETPPARRSCCRFARRLIQPSGDGALEQPTAPGSAPRPAGTARCEIATTRANRGRRAASPAGSGPPASSCRGRLGFRCRLPFQQPLPGNQASHQRAHDRIHRHQDLVRQKHQVQQRDRQRCSKPIKASCTAPFCWLVACAPQAEHSDTRLGAEEQEQRHQRPVAALRPAVPTSPPRAASSSPVPPDAAQVIENLPARNERDRDSAQARPTRPERDRRAMRRSASRRAPSDASGAL